MTIGATLMALALAFMPPQEGGEPSITEPHVWRIVSASQEDSVAIMPVEPGDGDRRFFWMVQTFNQTVTAANVPGRQFASVHVIDCSERTIDLVLSEAASPDIAPTDWRLWGRPGAVQIVERPAGSPGPRAPSTPLPVISPGTTLERIGTVLCGQEAGHMPEIRGTWPAVLTRLRQDVDAQTASTEPFSWTGEWELLRTPDNVAVLSRPGRDRPGVNAEGILAVIDTKTYPGGAQQMLQEAAYACAGVPGEVSYLTLRARVEVTSFSEPFSRRASVAGLNLQTAAFNPEDPLHAAIHDACSDIQSGEMIAGSWSEVLSRVRPPANPRPTLRR